MSREDYIYYARLAEQGERYEDMIKYMKEVSKVSQHIAAATSRKSNLIWYRMVRNCLTRSAIC